MDTCAPGAPVTEVCDGADNDFDCSTGEGFDMDLDGVADCVDNCPTAANTLQEDLDLDGFRDVCDFTLIAPHSASVFARAARPATFRWLPQNKTVFQVQRTASNAPFAPWINSFTGLKPGTSFTPSTTLWRQILKLSNGDKTIYWRVIGQKPPDQSVPSDQVFSFTVTPRSPGGGSERRSTQRSSEH